MARATKRAERVERITASTLKERGWTEAAVKRFLGEPDALADNPYYRSAAPMRLYDLARVETTEQSAPWQEWFESGKARRAAASVRQTARMDECRAQLAAEIRAVKIRLPQLEEEALFRAAVKNRNAQAQWHVEERGRHDFHRATVASADPAALQRWAVNYLRHVETEYDWLLDRVTGRVGVDEGRRLIRKRILDAIADRYPYLAQECSRQAREW